MKLPPIIPKNFVVRRDHHGEHRKRDAMGRYIVQKTSIAAAGFGVKAFLIIGIAAIVFILVGSATGTVTEVARSLTSLSDCNATVLDKNELIKEAELNGEPFTEEEKAAINNDKNVNACRIQGAGYNGDTYPPTTGYVSTLYGVVDALHPTGHGGMDIASACGTPIYAFAGGTVTKVVLGTEGKSSLGNYVYPGGWIYIQHTDSYVTRYHHLKGSTTYVKEGDIVSAGDHIADQWSNGHSTGCHLHYEAFLNGVRTDPLDALHAAGYMYEYQKNFTPAMLPPKPTGGSELIALDPASVKGNAQAQLAGRGLTAAGEWSCLETLWTRESSWNHTAQNNAYNRGAAPTPANQAYGIPQAAPGSKMAAAGADWQTNPATQIKWGLDYIVGRYGTPCAALNHSYANNWY